MKPNLFARTKQQALNNFYKPTKKRRMKKVKDPDVLIKKIVKAVVTTKSALPVLEQVLLTGDQLTVSDLETSVIMPFASGIEACMPANKFLDVLDMMAEPVFTATLHELEKGKSCTVEVSEGRRKIKVQGEHPDNFPLVLNKEYFELGELTEHDLKLLQVAIAYVSNDDLRPAMTGVFFSDNIAATDAHRLFWHPIEPMLENFILPRRSASILLKIEAKHWRVFGNGEQVVFLSDEGIIMETRAIDARFPDYKVVIPHDQCRATFTVNPTVLRKEIKNALAFGNAATKQVMFCLNGKVEIKSQDVDFEHEYSMELTDKEATVEFHELKNWPAGTRVIVQGRAGTINSVVNGKCYKVRFDDQESKWDATEEVPHGAIEIVDDLCIAFNGDFLDDIALRLKDEPIVMQLWSPTKCGIINDHFLVMPLMINE
jgi:DNA polymerase III subunit beta